MTEIVFGNGPVTATISGATSVTSGSGADFITFSNSVTDSYVDLGAGNDRLTLAAGGNTLTVANIETLTGGSGADVVSLGGAMTGGRIDLGDGADALTLSASGATLTVANVETLTGGASTDVVTLSAAFTAGTIDLGDGNDRLTLANAANTVTVANVETITGGTGDDIVVITGSSGVVANLGAGNDQIIGGTGADTLTGGTGSDQFVFTAADQSPTGTPDVITDFVPGTDTLVFEGLQTGSFNYLGTDSLEASAGHSQARFDDTTHVLQVDVGGDGSADMEIQLTGKTASQLSVTNFQWS